MRKRLLTNRVRTLAFGILGLIYSTVSSFNASAQCSFLNNQYPSGNVASPTTVGQTVQVSTCSYAGEFASVTGFQSIYIYTINVTGLPTGYITVFDASNVAVAYGPAPLSFIPPTNGDYKTQWTSSGPASCGTDFSCHTTTVQLTSQANPSVPPTPTQDPGSPTCTGGTTLSVAGSPTAPVQWYWQTSATGTSTTTPFAGTYTVYANGTYYLRAYDSSTMLWSTTSSSVTVSNFPVATPPPAPTADVTPSCAPAGSVLSVASAPAGYAYYWQGTVLNGSSMANPATATYNATSTGTYYVSAYETATQCWSNTVGIAITVDSYIPPAPLAVNDPVNTCVGSMSVPVEAVPSATSGSAVITFGTNYTLVPGPSTLNGTLTIPVGATITSSVLTFDDVTTGPSQWLSDMSFSLSGASTYPNTSFTGTGATNAGPFNYNTTTNPAGGAVTLNMNNSWFQDGTFGTITLTVNYSVPVPSITWFDAASGGANLGTGSPFEAYGTTVLPNTSSAGSHTIYAAATVGGCNSTTTPITINVTPVLATLNPVDATCNGLDNGSFTLGTVTCGTTPFTYSLDNGVTYGAIPTDLVAGTYYVMIQDANMLVSAPITVVVNEPTAPTNLTVLNATYFTADLDWTPEGDETSWNIEYGPAGFTPGTGTTVNVTAHPATITGLSADTEYEFYVAAGCAAGSAYAGPVSFATDPGFFTWDSQCGPGFMDISTTGTALNLTDDATTIVTAPFPISFLGSSDDQITISNNGWLTNSTGGAWDVFSQDLDDEEGNVYYGTATDGTDTYFVVQWESRPHFPGVIGQNATFEFAYNQTTGEVYYIYEDVVFGGTQNFADYGAGAYIAAGGPDDNVVVSNYDPTYLSSNSCIHFYNALCPNVQNFTSLIYPDDALLDWDAGLYGETEWTMVYGLAGFDPNVPGEVLGTQALSSSDASFGTTLTQLTCYDVYIYSECTADNLTSDGFFYSFCTLPYCSNPDAITGTSDVDSIEMVWNWTETPGYPISSFNIQYGMNGMTATEVVANGVDYSDTIADASLLAGGVYEVYVQAACSTGDTSGWVGPITVVMPLSNDTVCGSEALALGNTYTFNNAGATVSIDEVNIAPPATGAQMTNGWANSTLNGTTWFEFVAPASGSVRINNTAINYNGQTAVYDVADCGDFNSNFIMLAANDNEIGGTSLASNFTVCGLTPNSVYYIMHDGSGTSGIYSISISEIVLEAGLAQPLTQICTGDVIDLFTTINGNDTGGEWSAPVAAADASISGSTFNSNGLGYQVFDFQYRMTDGCAYDSIISQVQIFPPSSAGTDGTLTVCKNEPVDLLAGLGGTADLGGTWYDPTNNAMPSSLITASAFPGSFNYDYITGNGVCPDDTSNVVLTVLPSCDYLSIQEEVFAGVEVYPNPTTGILNIDADQAFAVKVTDANGRVIRESAQLAAGTSTIDLAKVQIGVYFVELSNEKATKVFRIVVQ